MLRFHRQIGNTLQHYLCRRIYVSVCVRPADMCDLNGGRSPSTFLYRERFGCHIFANFIGTLREYCF